MYRLRVGAAVVCIIFVFSLVLIPFANADWIMFRSDPSHSGVGTGNATLTPKLLWKYTDGTSIDSSPTVAGGIVYVGSEDGNVYALNAASGVELWKYTTGIGVISSPAVVGGVVYIGSDDDNVYALNATSGTYIWSYPTGDRVWSSPAVVGGLVYVGSDDGNVYALGASPPSSNTPFIIIGVVVAVVIIATLFFLIYRKRLKTKPASPLL
jgi:hypothetical protein